MGPRMRGFLCFRRLRLRRVVVKISHSVAAITICLSKFGRNLDGGHTDTLRDESRVSGWIASGHAHVRSARTRIFLDERPQRVARLGRAAWSNGAGVLLPARRHTRMHPAGVRIA